MEYWHVRQPAWRLVYQHPKSYRTVGSDTSWTASKPVQRRIGSRGRSPLQSDDSS